VRLHSPLSWSPTFGELSAALAVAVGLSAVVVSKHLRERICLNMLAISIAPPDRALALRK